MIGRPWKKFFSFVFVLLILSFQVAAQGEIAGPYPPRNLRCEYLENPMGMDVKKPRFSWMLEHSERGQAQTAYQVIVSSAPSCEDADIWDSNKVMSDQSLHVIFDGKPLQSD